MLWENNKERIKKGMEISGETLGNIQNNERYAVYK